MPHHLRSVLVALLMLGLLALARAPEGADAERSDKSAPVLYPPASTARSVVFKGVARPWSTVRLQVAKRVRGTSRWVTTRTVRSTRRGTFRFQVARAPQATKYRAIARGRTSVVRSVSKPPPEAAGPKAVTVPPPATGGKVVPKPPPVVPPLPSGTGTVTPAYPETRPAPSDACGTRPPRGDGTYYDCTFRDDFDGTGLDRSRWHVMNQPYDRLTCAVDDPRTVEVRDGTLRLSARPSGPDLPCPATKDGTRAPYAVGWVNTFWKWSQQYGRFEARVKSQAVAGAGPQEAFWLWPDVRYHSDDDWPASGEIDIVENYAVYPGLAIPFLHYTENDNGGTVPGLNTAWDCAAPRGQWHTYALEWTADRLQVFVDGRSCLVNVAGAESFRKLFIMSFTQLLSSVGANTYTGSVPLPVTMEVDYVKVWR